MVTGPPHHISAFYLRIQLTLRHYIPIAPFLFYPIASYFRYIIPALPRHSLDHFSYHSSPFRLWVVYYKTHVLYASYTTNLHYSRPTFCVHNNTHKKWPWVFRVSRWARITGQRPRWAPLDSKVPMDWESMEARYTADIIRKPRVKLNVVLSWHNPLALWDSDSHICRCDHLLCILMTAIALPVM